MSTFPEIERRDNPPMPYEEYRTRELWAFGRRLAIAFFVVGVPLVILVWPWGGK
jgi:hypothetical protein